MATLGSDEMFAKFVEAAGIPQECTRMVIDMSLNDIVRIYWSGYANEDLIKVITPENLKDALVVKVGG